MEKKIVVHVVTANNKALVFLTKNEAEKAASTLEMYGVNAEITTEKRTAVIQ